MVTPQGFNALLKIVEEPPEHVMFIFATTEPDKVIGTIRSRTHHYPFRLVPQEVMGPYLERICSDEHIEAEPGVLRLAMRAGGGSVRDTLARFHARGTDRRGDRCRDRQERRSVVRRGAEGRGRRIRSSSFCGGSARSRT